MDQCQRRTRHLVVAPLWLDAVRACNLVAEILRGPVNA